MIITLIFLMFMLPIGLIAITLLGSYKMFEKAGVEPWKGLVPFYNIYVMTTEICGLNMWWAIAAMVGSCVPVIGSVVTVIASININWAIAKKFDQDETGIILTCIFAPIMYCVFGFGQAKFKDVKLDEHGLFQSVIESNVNNYKESTTKKKTNTTNKYEYCRKCGAQVEKTDKYCQSCGKELK